MNRFRTAQALPNLADAAKSFSLMLISRFVAAVGPVRQALTSAALALLLVSTSSVAQSPQRLAVEGGDAGAASAPRPRTLVAPLAVSPTGMPNLSPNVSRRGTEPPVREPYVQGEFERFVQNMVGNRIEIRRLGSELMVGSTEQDDADLIPAVPSDYVVSAGDEVIVTLWGSVDAELRLTVDRTGQISIPRVGTVRVAGVSSADLQDTISRRVAQVYRNFQLSVSLGQLRGIRVFVTGFAHKPGSYTVSSLSTVVSALMGAGGPSSAGSFRDIQLRRGSQTVAAFDLYDLLIKGDRSADRTLKSGDVVHVGPSANQVGIIGSVNKAVVAELKPGETVADAIRFAAGFSAVADRSRIALERLEDRRGVRIGELNWPSDAAVVLSAGDVVRVFSAVDVALPNEKQNNRVRVEGQVVRPSEYILPAGSTVADALKAAGGLTGSAYLFATEFTRESVRLSQQENYDRALRDLEVDLTRGSSSQRVATADEAATQLARANNTTRLIERMRLLKPTGRVVLQLTPSSSELPPLMLEDGDRLFIPARPTSVGVFGSVFNAAAYLHLPGRTLDDYVRLSGGTTKGADANSVFVVRANGSVISSRQRASGWFAGNKFGELVAEAGDTVFVPEEVDKTSFVQSAKDWTQILYQFGLGLAGIKVLIP